MKEATGVKHAEEPTADTLYIAQSRHAVPLAYVFSGHVNEQSPIEAPPKEAVVVPPGQEVQVLEVDPVEEE